MHLPHSFQSASTLRFRSVLKFILPTYLTCLFNTLYSIVDGVFVSHFVGTNALASLNIVYPIVDLLTGISLAFAIGGSAMAALSLGRKEGDKANSQFSVSLILSTVICLACTGIVFLFLPEILGFLGETPLIRSDCRIYIFMWLISTPAIVGKEIFTAFIRADGAPGYSFFLAVVGGIANIILDFFFIVIGDMGVFGAGLATCIGMYLSLFAGIFYFIKEKRNLRFTWKNLSLKVGFRCGINGFSGFIEQMAFAITTVAFNRQALLLSGEDGVAAVTVIMYLQFIFIGVYNGYSLGISPIFSYAYGNRRWDVLKKMEKYSYLFFLILPPLLYGLALVTSPFFITLFTGEARHVYDLAVYGMKLYGIAFIFSGFNIFSAQRLIAYGKGHFSASVTFLRSFALLLLALVLLPHFFGINGLWLSLPAAEAGTLLYAVVLTLMTPLKKLMQKQKGA